MLYDVMEIFGEPTDEIAQHKKYAKWKAAYIHNCLKNGETPIPGPMGDDGESMEDDEGVNMEDGATGWNHPADRRPEHANWPDENEMAKFRDSLTFPSTSGGGTEPVQMPPQGGLNIPFAGVHAPPSTPSEMPSTPPANISNFQGFDDLQPKPPPGGVELSAEDFTLAQKYCKWAGSALQYEDAPTAIENLQKALMLLTTGLRS